MAIHACACMPCMCVRVRACACVRVLLFVTGNKEIL